MLSLGADMANPILKDLLQGTARSPYEREPGQAPSD